MSIAAREYLVFGNVLPDIKPAHVDYGYADALGDLYNTGTGRIALTCGASMIDQADYADVAPGESRQLDGGAVPDYTANDNLANWCAASSSLAEFEPANRGTPGAANEDCAVITPGMCNDGGTLRATVPPAAGDLVITEVMPNPDLSDDALGEWFEVRAMTDVDLNGVTLDRTSDSSDGDLIGGEDCIHLAAGEYAVFAKSTDTTMNGGLPAVAGTFGFSMVTGSVASPGDVAVFVDATLIDMFAWTGSSTGASLQVDPDFADATANDDETKWCDATTPYGLGDLGTPGADNGECVILPPPGMCEDATAGLRAIVNPAVGDIVITEVMPSPAAVGDAVGEWFEAVALTSFDLNDLGLDRAGDTSAPDVVTSIACLPVIAGTRLLFARNTDPGMNGGLPTVDAVFGFSLVGGSVATPGDVQLVIGPTPTVLDAVTWTGSSNGASIQLDPDFTNPIDNDDEANFCDGATPYGLGDLGTPASANAECGGGGATCLDAGTPRPIVNPVVGDLVITEVMPSPNAVGDSFGEWFEVLATANVDLNGVGLDRAGDTSAPNVITSADCVAVTAGSYLVFARNADPTMNGMLPAVTSTFTFSMVGGPGDVRLVAPDTTTVLDAITWTTSPNGASLALDPDTTDVVSNDTESNFCPGTTVYGAGDLGSPAAANAQCPVVVPPGSCLDGGSGLVRPIDKPVAGEVTITEWMPDPSLVTDTAGEWIEVLASADFDANEIQLGAATLGAPLSSTSCLPVMAGTRLLFARNANSSTNGGLPTVFATYTASLLNSNGTVQVGVDSVALDTRTYVTSSPGKSIQLDTDGTQCNAPTGTPLYNGTDAGTPAAAHTTECP